MNSYVKVANLDPQYRANMVPLIFAQEWGHFSVIFAYKFLKLCNFYWKIIKFWPMFLHKLTGIGVCTKMAHQIIPHSSPLTHVSAQIDMYGSLCQKWLIKLWSSKRLVATSLRPVFSLFQNPGNCNQTDHQRAWTTTAVRLQPMVGLVQLPVFWKVLDWTLEH